MRWNKLGLVWGPDGKSPWAKSHAMVPTPFRLNAGVIRVYVTSRDEQGRGRTGYVDVAASDPTKVLGFSKQPLLDLGAPGTFDDSGALIASVVEPEPGTQYMYYSGFELCTKIPYRMLAGLAISTDGGKTFKRHSKAPILDRSDSELYFRCAPFVLYEDGMFKLWYIAGSHWTELNGKAVPVYDLRFQTSPDGISWQEEGLLSMPLSLEDEHGFGRPWVVWRGKDNYQLFYSVRRRSYGGYRLGYAESSDGVTWTRMDDQMGLDVSADGFDSKAIAFSAPITVDGRTYCFYNGNDFGKDGFAVAELVG